MVRYLLTYRTSKLWFYASKLIVLLTVVVIAMIIALIAYLAVFSIMDVPMLDAGALAASMVFPFLIATVFSAIGLMLSTLSSKKAGAIVASVAIFFLLSFLSTASIGMGVMAAYDINPDVTAHNVTEFIPLEYKLLIYANPLVLSSGTTMILDAYAYDHFTSPHLYDLPVGIALGLFMLLWFGVGLVGFSRERMDKDWLTHIVGRLRKR